MRGLLWVAWRGHTRWSLHDSQLGRNQRITTTQWVNPHRRPRVTLDKGKKVSKQGLTSITLGPKNVYTRQGRKKAVVIKMWDWQDLNFEIYVSQMERSRNILKTIESPIHILVWESRGPFRLKVFKHSEFPLSDARHLKILLIIYFKKHVPLSIRLITKPKMYLCTCLQSVSG